VGRDVYADVQAPGEQGQEGLPSYEPDGEEREREDDQAVRDVIKQMHIRRDERFGRMAGRPIGA